MNYLIHHKMYFKVARENLEQALLSEKSVRSWMLDSSNWIKQESIDKSYSEFSESAITSIIFSGLTVESFINYYGISRLSKNEFDNYLDKLDLLSKWIVIPKFVTGNSIDTGSHAISLLKQLIRSRNKLVHYKSSKISPHDFYSSLKNFQPTDPKSRLPWIEDAEIGIQAIYKLLSEIVKIDSSISREETEWEEESDKCFQMWSIFD
ncbi:hypothetical protein [Trichormus sp. NMC-1]|uniref:hypothetical protein n=1 Tax=Trichormus sp. NMC-1 TaxID=1853259 RepID=UPI00115F8AE1|nr:hypothetical protein [Trichormus sp. NMC-1]